MRHDMTLSIVTPPRLVAIATGSSTSLPGGFPAWTGPPALVSGQQIGGLDVSGQQLDRCRPLAAAGAPPAHRPGCGTLGVSACLLDLCFNLSRSFDRLGAPSLSCAADDHHLPIGTLITLELIIDLLVSNAYVHGFPPPAGGRIAISLLGLESAFELTIDDSGRVDVAGAASRADGETIAAMLVHQLGGWIETPSVIAGHRCVISLPRLSASASS